MIRLFALAISLASTPMLLGAQCTAWVLWEEHVVYRSTESGPGSGRTTWSVRGAYESRQVCDTEAAKGSSDVVLQALQDDKFEAGRVASFKRYDPSWMIAVFYKDGSRRTLDWQCLPDIVDPRPR